MAFLPRYSVSSDYSPSHISSALSCHPSCIIMLSDFDKWTPSLVLCLTPSPSAPSLFLPQASPFYMATDNATRKSVCEALQWRVIVATSIRTMLPRQHSLTIQLTTYYRWTSPRAFPSLPLFCDPPLTSLHQTHVNNILVCK